MAYRRKKMRTILVAVAFLLYAVTYVSAVDAKFADAVTKQTGEKCDGKETFDMEATNSVTGVFSVRCEDGREFLLLIQPDGSMKAIPCKQTTVRCFKTYKEQESG
jgi:hypothetical protein